MKKSMLFAAAAVVAMVGCTNEDFTGVQEAPNGSMAINFGSGSKKITRAENITGEAAATDLNNNFVVYGFKSADELSTNPTLSSIVEVFDHYSVNYATGTAGSTESNSKNWEYVGQDMCGLQTNAKSQTIKYWDFAMKQYDYVAFSKGINTADYATLFSKVTPANIGTSDPVYTVTGTVEELQNCYIADLLTADPVAYAKEAKAVTPVFRKMASKIRLGIYETIPGYSVKDVKFYTASTEPTAMKLTSTEKKDEATLFASSAIFPDNNSKGVMKVTFPTIGDAEPTEAKNKAFINFTADAGATKETTLTFAELNYDGVELYEPTGEYLGRTSATASYAGDYISVLPKNSQDVIKLQVDYTLVSIDGSKETMTVYGATAEIPAIYTEWQPNYAYTYLFKISDQTNGYVDPSLTDPLVGLYPITFDAMVMNDENGIQETITEFGKPSITTYQKGKVVTENDEYKAEKNIYVTVNNGATLTADHWAVGAVNVFKATIDNDALQTITEASVANCIEQNYDPTNTYATCQVTDANFVTLQLTKLTNNTDWKLLTDIPAADAPHGVTIKTNGTNTCVAQITEPAAGTYVFQYLETPATYDDAPFNTIETEKSFWTLAKAPTDKGYTYTYTKTPSAVGNEVWAADTYYKSIPILGTAITSPKTLTAGKIYYNYDNSTSTYTQFVANGYESWTNTYYGYDVKPALCYGNLTDNKIPAGGTYFVRDGDKYEEVTAAAEIKVKATDKYYYFGSTDKTATAYTLVAVAEDADNANTLAKGTKYFKDLASPAEGYMEFVSDGTEAWENDIYFTSVETPAEAYVLSEFNTLATGLTYFTGTDAAPTATTANGKETTSTVTGAKVVKTMPTYYYKVIKVVE